eukprot:TRINITY_DN32058_c0_g1_i1.p1 TRINITY_DN32058_c0_g1~~TRINITY_DN32058_c0_g1_i1.p1  ORF type:complete len:469 (+),score=94.90 TRINITY_DN32058_c0_g1_i1:93-1409(+)
MAAFATALFSSVPSCLCVDQESTTASAVVVTEKSDKSPPPLNLDERATVGDPSGKAVEICAEKQRPPRSPSLYQRTATESTCSGFGSVGARDITELDIITDATIQDAIDEAMGEVEPWCDKDIKVLQLLQKAPCNLGEVLLAEMSGTKVAVKKMPNSWVSSSHSDFVKRFPSVCEKPWYDIGILKNLGKTKYDYDYACAYLGMFRDDEFTYVATELATEGDLFTWCSTHPVPTGPERELTVKTMALQLFSAVRGLHDIGIAHRDISSENILITAGPDGEPRIKLIDFGMASTDQYCLRGLYGKKTYRAPEMHTSDVYDTFLADDFSVGVVLYCMAIGDYPWKCTKAGVCKLFEFTRLHGMQTFFANRRARMSKHFLNEVTSCALVEILEGLLQFEPGDRLCLGESCYLNSGTQSVWGKEWTLQTRVIEHSSSEFRVVV